MFLFHKNLWPRDQEGDTPSSLGTQNAPGLRPVNGAYGLPRRSGSEGGCGR
jgi:hypothetical protein